MTKVIDLIPEICPALGPVAGTTAPNVQAPTGIMWFFDSIPGPQISDYGGDKVFGELFLGWYS